MMDKRLWFMILIRHLSREDQSISYSYDNLIGNFNDGQIGLKIRKKILDEYILTNNKHNEEFYSSFYK